MTLREREVDPPPQASEQPLQLDHAETWQLITQGCVLHGCVCVTAGHEAPPNAGCVVMLRVRVSVPPPHETEQFHELHAETTQSTGQGCGDKPFGCSPYITRERTCVLHACVSTSGLQRSPLLVGFVTIVRERSMVLNRAMNSKRAEGEHPPATTRCAAITPVAPGRDDTIHYMKSVSNDATKCDKRTDLCSRDKRTASAQQRSPSDRTST